MSSPEQPIDPSVYQGEKFEAEISETSETFTAVVRSGGETVLFRYTPPGDMSFKIVSPGTPLSASPAAELLPDDRLHTARRSPEPEPTPETEHTVKLYGRPATEPF